MYLPSGENLPFPEAPFGDPAVVAFFAAMSNNPIFACWLNYRSFPSGDQDVGFPSV